LAAWAVYPQHVTRDAAALARLCAWLETAELLPVPLGAPPGVQAFDIELLRRQLLLASLAAGRAGYGPAVTELRYLVARYAPPAIAALARADDLPGPLLQRQGHGSAATVDWPRTTNLPIDPGRLS
jgi:hypothetical protein